MSDIVYVFTQNRVATALQDLRACSMHQHTAGYLCLLQTATKAQSFNNLAPRFKTFWDEYFRVSDTPENYPYIQPFAHAGTALELSGRNVAGSYAPSSFRPNSPIALIGRKRNETAWGLRRNHDTLATQHLPLGERRISLASLSVFLFRDHGFDAIPNARMMRGVLDKAFGFPFGNAGFSSSSIVKDDLATLGRNDIEILS